MREPVDVCIIVEGTYPYVAGGVSSWVHQVIQALPELRFAVIHIAPLPDPHRRARYQLPENVVSLSELAIHHTDWVRASARAPGRRNPGQVRAVWEQLGQLHHQLHADGSLDGFDAIADALAPSSNRACTPDDLFYSSEAWDLLTALHRQYTPDSSFVDFFWTWRYTHLPLFYLLDVEVPLARVYHTVSTGYAGFLAAMAKRRTGAPMLLTEHGIYNRERKIEIAQAEWIYVKERPYPGIARQYEFFKQWWIGMFRFLSRVTYAHADQIITITKVNQQFQLEDGADPTKMRVVPNAISLQRFAGLRQGGRQPDAPFRVGFIGRVVPIKDVKTFIRAIKIAAATIPRLEVFIVGPTDEDPEYFQECQRLTQLLELESIITYTGRADVRAYYAKIDVVVLTSISEAQPLVILEGHAAGVPAIATDVGACAELLHGGTAEDRALGPSGIITGVANPTDTAQALIRLWRDVALWEQMARAGAERVRRYYDEARLFETYRQLYREYGEKFARCD